MKNAGYQLFQGDIILIDNDISLLVEDLSG
jgi:hypothetical protein